VGTDSWIAAGCGSFTDVTGTWLIGWRGSSLQAEARIKVANIEPIESVCWVVFVILIAPPLATT
jgi:hypothetical protein